MCQMSKSDQTWKINLFVLYSKVNIFYEKSKLIDLANAMNYVQ